VKSVAPTLKQKLPPKCEARHNLVVEKYCLLKNLAALFKNGNGAPVAL
jgi:hypothetical protein